MKPSCWILRWFLRKVVQRSRRVITKSFPGTERSVMPRYLEQILRLPFRFQRGRMMLACQSFGIHSVRNTMENSTWSQRKVAAPPYFSSSAGIPQNPGARLFFIRIRDFRISVEVKGCCTLSHAASGVLDATGRSLGSGWLTQSRLRSEEK